VISSVLTGWVMPALLTRMSMRPNRQHGGRGSLAGSLVGHVGHQAQVMIAQAGGRGGGIGLGQVQHHHAGALFGHQARGGVTESVESRTAGDDGDLVLEQHVVISRCLR
jgi:hypothetical protein